MAHSSDTMIGRDAELRQIATALGVLPAGGAMPRPGVVLLSGDAGVGKTRLLIELRDLAQEHGWLVLAGHCIDFGDSALPYMAFSELLGRLVAELPDVVDEVGGLYPALARLQPGRRVMSGQERGDDESRDAALDRADLLDGVHALLERAAEKAPLVVVIEDAHWADPSTRDMLGFLFSRPFEGPVSLVASYRSDDLHRRHPLRRQVAEWARLRGVDRIQLEPLPDPAVRTLVGELAAEGGDRLVESQVSDIVRRAEGNAFFVEELVASGSGPDRWLPDDLADVLLVRLDRLDEHAHQVVRAASVGGRRVSHDLLAAAAGLEPAAFDDAVRQAVETNVLVIRNGSYEFRHALLGEAVYDDLLPGERVRLHGRYCDALREGSASGTAAELAMHARRAHSYDTAVTASIQAGQEAYAVGGPDEAADHFQAALELLEDPARRARLDVDLAKVAVHASDALSAGGHTERAAAVLGEQLDRLPTDAPPAWRPRLLAAYATALVILETELDTVALSEEAVAIAPEGESVLRAKVLAAHARVLSSAARFDEAQAVGTEALALAERLDRPVLVSEIFTTLSGLKKHGPREPARAALADAVERASRTGALEPELRARYLLGRLHQDAAEWSEAARWFGSAMERGMEAGQRWGPYCLESRWQLAWVRLVTGEWDDVLALTAMAVDKAAPPIPRAMLRAIRLAVPLSRGEDVDAHLSDLRGIWEREGGVAIHAAGLQIQSAGLRADASGALAVYDDAVDVLGRIWHTWFGARIRLAALTVGAICRALPQASGSEREAWVTHVDRLYADGATVLNNYGVGQPALNHEAYRNEHAHPDPSGSWGPEGRAWSKRLDAETLRARWLAGVDAPPQEVLLEVWAEAEQLTAEFGHVHELAQVRTTLARLHRTLGDHTEARRLGDLARETAHRLDARPLLDQLVEIGSTPVRGRASSDTLTPRESEILALVAQGRSNGEIGRQLFIATKTVSVHVSNILGKLGASGRTEAVAIARQRGLLG